MASLTELFLKVGNITGASPDDLHGDYAEPRFRPGSISILSDAFGMRVLKYVKTLSAQAMGTSVSAASAGTDQRQTDFTLQTGTNNTKQAAITGATANRHNGMIFWVANSTAGTGVAPEGEASIVASNTATVLKLEPSYPLSATLTATDTVQCVATWQVEAGAATDQGWVYEGVVVGRDGLTAGNYGWIQTEGLVVANTDGTAQVVGSPVVAAASGTLADDGAQTNEDWVGTSMITAQNDQVNDRSLVRLSRFSQAYGITAH